jgi:hypothetical protein
VTRGTRPKKPSSRGFAREARGARGVRGVWGFWGFWGLETENRKLKIISLFPSWQQLPKKLFYFILFLIFNF